MSSTTYFSDAAAVDAWDTWFRWRDGAVLRDRTIDSTWQRIANAIAGGSGANAALWALRYTDAFSQWRLVPDERLLRIAGTGRPLESQEPLHAVLNIGAFVVAPGSARGRLDLERIADTAALAVRLLDDAVFAVPQAGQRQTAVHVGAMGMADALRLLDTAYDSAKARAQARDVAVAMASGTLRGSVELASERGSGKDDAAALADLWRARGMAAPLVDDALRWGVRHARVTAIEPHPQLALLANNATDALDPLLIDAPDEDTRPKMDPLRRHAIEEPSLRAQIELRAAMQPWIDLPIAYPLVAQKD